jgi:hypothetical protein
VKFCDAAHKPGYQATESGSNGLFNKIKAKQKVPQDDS